MSSAKIKKSGEKAKKVTSDAVPLFTAGQSLLIRQIRSNAARPMDQKRTLQSMGLGRIGHTTTQRLDKSLLGKLKKIWHLIEVESV